MSIRLVVGATFSAALLASFIDGPAAAQPAPTRPSGPPQVAGRVLTLDEAVAIAL